MKRSKNYFDLTINCITYYNTRNGLTTNRDTERVVSISYGTIME